MILAKQPTWSFPLHCACFRGCTICVDTLHYLCRVCFERPLFKGILYSWNVPFCRIDSFYRLILFRIMFRIKGGIYTNNVPPCDNDSCETTNSVIPAALRLFQGCTICVDTLHYLCRMCAERPLLKGIFYSWNILFCRIHLFCDLNILFKADFPIRFVVMPWCRKKQHTACFRFAVCCLCEVPYLLTKWHWTQLCMSYIWVMLRLMYWKRASSTAGCCRSWSATRISSASCWMLRFTLTWSRICGSTIWMPCWKPSGR